MTQTYHLRLDNDTRIDLRADSAGNAIGRTLLAHPGRKVVKCWLGDPFEQLQENAAWGENSRIDFEIPPHEPITPGAEQQAPEQAELFPEEKSNAP